ncbi:MAG TPA: SPOR domain-containing protein [candidate division Zixibacteria bacterium]|nr:SPOR domain-containing protein [candidate division Zixibacteria bacterium]
MKTTTLKGLLLILAVLPVPLSRLSARPNLTSAWQEYYKGAFPKASEKLREFIRDTATAEAYFLAAKLEPDGEKAKESLEKSLEDPARGEFFRRALAELSQYHLATKNYGAVIQLKERFPSFFESKSFNPELAYYLAKAYRLLGRRELGLKYSEQILTSYPSHPIAGWAGLEKGLCFLDGKKSEAGIEEFRKLVARGGSEEVTVALLILAKNLSEAKGKIYSRIYEEKFPKGLGRTAGGNGQTAVSSKRYQIEIGPFGSKSEAQRAFLKLKADSKEAEITSRQLNNRTYYFIRWGDFSSSAEAGRTQKELEKILKASYSVVELEG